MTASDDMLEVQLPLVHEVALRPAYSLLPAKMNSTKASVLLMAIGLQESLFIHRIQLIGSSRRWWESLKGPARGAWQFELYGGVRGVLKHSSSRPYALYVLDALRYPDNIWWIYRGIAHNDVLACCFARLLLWTDPRELPSLGHPPEVWWKYYIRNWRPGKPHRETWDDNWTRALHAMEHIDAERYSSS